MRIWQHLIATTATPRETQQVQSNDDPQNNQLHRRKLRTMQTMRNHESVCDSLHCWPQTTAKTNTFQNEHHAHKSKSSVHRNWICNAFCPTNTQYRSERNGHVVDQQNTRPRRRKRQTPSPLRKKRRRLNALVQTTHTHSNGRMVGLCPEIKPSR